MREEKDEMGLFDNPSLFWLLVAMGVATVVAMIGGMLCVSKPYPSPVGAMGLMALIIGGIAMLVIAFVGRVLL